MKYVQATISTTVQGIADLYPTNSGRLEAATITVRSGALNVTWDGTEPTTATGMKQTTTSLPLTIRGLAIARMRLIRDAAVDAVIDVMFT